MILLPMTLSSLMIASSPCAAAIRWMLAIMLACALLAALSSAADAQSALVPAPQTIVQETAGQEAAGGPWQTTLQYLHQKQGELHRRLASAVRGLKGEGGQQALLFLLALSFLYGVFHAVGPGHGKAVISTYLLANERAVRRGIALAFLASFVQGLTAIALVAVLAVLLDMSGLRVTSAVGMLESASYALVAAVGFCFSGRSCASAGRRSFPRQEARPAAAVTITTPTRRCCRARACSPRLAASSPPSASGPAAGLSWFCSSPCSMASSSPVWRRQRRCPWAPRHRFPCWPWPPSTPSDSPLRRWGTRAAGSMRPITCWAWGVRFCSSCWGLACLPLRWARRRRYHPSRFDQVTVLAA
ncbi:MAG TPA: hypothetical protein EYH07_13840 [Kiloniellaceae bacterium]|nr:hypothetical protein [Kiloniellaceae bacterium]